MPVKRALAAVLVLLLVVPLVFSGCEQKISAQEVADKVMLYYLDVETFGMDMDIIMNADINSGGQKMKMDTTLSAEGYFDNAAHQMQMMLDGEIDISGLGEQKVSEEIYVVDGQMYIKLSVSETDQWMKMDLSDQLWEKQNQMEQQVDFLRSAVKIDIIGQETVNGIDCYILDIQPDMVALFEWYESQQQELTSKIDYSQLDIGRMFKDFSLKEWVAKDTFLPVKNDISMELEFTAGDIGLENQTAGMTAEMQAQVYYYDINEPVTITLPRAALDAETVPVR